MSAHVNATGPQVVPITSDGTVYYLKPLYRPIILGSAMPNNDSSRAPMSVEGHIFVPAESVATIQTAPTSFMVQEVAQFLASSRKNNLPEWKPAQYNGDAVQ